MEVLDNEFIDHHYPSSVLQNLKTLWLSKRFCDATLEAGPVKIYVHRLMLIAMIPGLNQLQICTTGKPLEVILPATIKAEALNTIVHYLYTGTLHLTPQNAPWVEQIIHLLGLVKLHPFCKQYQYYLRRKKMVNPIVELYENPILVLSESERAVQVYYLESEQQLACLQGQLSISKFPSVIKNISAVKKEESDDKIEGIEAKNSELALNHSDFTLGTFLESSSKQRLHFQICSKNKDGEIYEANSLETVSIQRPSSEASTCTASGTCMMTDLLSSKENSIVSENGTVRKPGTANASWGDSKSGICEMEANMLLQQVKLEPVSENETECGVGRDISQGKGMHLSDEHKNGEQAEATHITRQKLHTSYSDQAGSHMTMGLSTMSQENEEFTLCCPLCLINFNSRESYMEHQSVCFDTFHHNQLFRLVQDEKMHQFCNSTPGASRVPYQSTTGGRVFSFVRHRPEDATNSSIYTIPVSPDRGKTRTVQQIKAQTENNNSKEMENPVLDGNSKKSGHKDYQNMPLSLSESGSITSERMEEKLSTAIKKSLLSDILGEDEVMVVKRQMLNHDEAHQSSNMKNTVPQNSIRENASTDGNDLKLKITDVWTLKDVNQHAEIFPEDSQRKSLNKAEDQPEFNKTGNRSIDSSRFSSLYNVEKIGNKLFIKRKTTKENQERNPTSDQPKTRTEKKSRQRRKQVSAEVSVHKDNRKEGKQGETKPDNEMARVTVISENTKNKIKECLGSDGKRGNVKIVVTQTPIKKLTSIITAISEGENKHLLKRKQGHYEVINSNARGSENEGSMLSMSNSYSASSIRKDQKTERKVYEFRERTTKVISQQVRDYLGIRDENPSSTSRNQHPVHQVDVCSPASSGAGELLSLSKNEASTKQDEPRTYNLVNTYSCPTNYPNVGPLVNCFRKSTLQEKIAKIHRENCIVIPKLWKDWKEQNSNKGTCEQLESKLMEVPQMDMKRVSNETEDFVNINEQSPSEVLHRYTVPLKKRKQY